MTSVTILAGGLGTRLRSVVSDLPKPLAPVNGRPFLRIVMDHWLTQGTTRFFLCVSHKAEKIREEIGLNYNGIPVTYLHEPSPEGTGGAFLRAARAINDDFVLINGDTYLPFRLSPDHFNNAQPTVSIALAWHDDRSDVGAVDLDDSEQRISGFQKGSRRAGWSNAGVYIFNKQALRIITSVPFGRPVSLETEIIPKIFSDNHIFWRPLKMQLDFTDIGTPERYKSFCDGM